MSARPIPCRRHVVPVRVGLLALMAAAGGCGVLAEAVAGTPPCESDSQCSTQLGFHCDLSSSPARCRWGTSSSSSSSSSGGASSSGGVGSSSLPSGSSSGTLLSSSSPAAQSSSGTGSSGSFSVASGGTSGASSSAPGSSTAGASSSATCGSASGPVPVDVPSTTTDGGLLAGGWTATAAPANRVLSLPAGWAPVVDDVAWISQQGNGSATSATTTYATAFDSTAPGLLVMEARFHAARRLREVRLNGTKAWQDDCHDTDESARERFLRVALGEGMACGRNVVSFVVGNEPAADGGFLTGLRLDVTWARADHADPLPPVPAACAGTPCGDSCSPPAGADIRDLSVGSSHACVVFSDGTACCTGLNPGGQLGNGGAGTTTGCPIQQVKQGTGPLTGVMRIAAGGAHTCALVDGGAVACWGAGAGLPFAPDGGVRCLPSSSAVLAGPFVDVAAGGDHTCVLDNDGGAACWGLGDHGQLAHGWNASAGPTRVVHPLGLAFRRVVARGARTCFIDENSATWCAGEDAREAPPVGGGLKCPSATAFPSWDRTRALAPQARATCALVDAPDGGSALECRGLHDGGSGSLVPDTSSAGAPSLVAAGNTFVCFAGDGGIACEGSVPGDGTPGAVPAYDLVTALAAGPSNACAAVRREAGVEVWCWGLPDNGLGAAGGALRILPP